MTTPALQAHGLGKSFHGVDAVVSLDLAVDAGEVVGFLGPNGAGKSTTLRMLLGLLRPTTGSATVRGHRAGSPEARADVAYVAGDVALWPQLTGAETIELLTSLHGSCDPRYRDELIARFDLDPSRRVRAYSRGNRQKVALIAALSTRAPVLLLDEPTSGLDPLMELVFRECVLEAGSRGQAVLLSSHLLAEVEHLCQRVAMIREGHLVRVADVEELRALADVEYEITGDVGDLAGVAGVSEVTPLVDGVRVRVHGSPGPLLAVLATRPVSALRTREASLEEIFLSFYSPASTT